ncbi:oligosaccharyltransferase complex subunit epsilon [Microbotryomycetes sp. JL201]|nr:oligosaccharyltransferase complex subunit epsilon [Microbotryomycetes sp. JL201]
MAPKQRTPHKSAKPPSAPPAAQHAPPPPPTTSVEAVSASYRPKSASHDAAATQTQAFSASLSHLWSNYTRDTPRKLQLCDGFQLFLMLTGIAQFVYCILITNYPFNAFIGGFAATVGQFVLTASLRSQVNPKNATTFPTLSPERALADYVFGTLVLHFFVYNYLG